MLTLGEKHPEWRLNSMDEDLTPYQAVCIAISAKIDDAINKYAEKGRGKFCSLEDGEDTEYTVFHGWIAAGGNYGEPMDFSPYGTPRPEVYMRIMIMFRRRMGATNDMGGRALKPPRK